MCKYWRFSKFCIRAHYHNRLESSSTSTCIPLLEWFQAQWRHRGIMVANSGSSYQLHSPRNERPSNGTRVQEGLSLCGERDEEVLHGGHIGEVEGGPRPAHPPPH